VLNDALLDVQKAKTEKNEENTKEKDSDVQAKDVDVDDLPDGWTRTDHKNGRIRIKDKDGNECLRYDPPTRGANEHWHHYGPDGTPWIPVATQHIKVHQMLIFINNI
jgi:hypothetical protein